MMKQAMTVGLVAAMVLVGCWASACLADGQSPPAYVIGPGDVLDVAEWKNPELTKMVVVLPDGKINFPLVGEMKASGKTVIQLAEEMSARLNRYVPEPNLSVVVHQVNSMMIYVIGKVNKPGRFMVNTNVNVLQALAIAGGLNSFAKRDQIKVFRDRGEKTAIFSFDYKAVAAGEDLGQNIALERGDVVVVR
jgi:polysaccharide export outer membrane protein